MLKRMVVILALVALAGCADKSFELTEPPEPLGDFRLGHNIVVTTNAQKVPPSRDATPEEWEAVLTSEIGRRFGRYAGDKYYNLGVSLDGYSLAVPGIPVVLAPKSAIVITVNIWDDAAGTKLNAEPKRLTILEGLNGETVLGSGLTKSRDEQMQTLAFNAARAIERWLVKSRQDWFGAPVAGQQTGGDTLEADAALAEAADLTPEVIDADLAPVN